MLDVDGTLMGPTGAVTDAVVAAAAAAVNAGVQVGYATGRNLAGLDGPDGRLGLAGPQIVLNGSQLRVGGRSVRTWPMAPADVAAIRSLCAERGWYAELYTDDAVLVTEMDDRFAAHWTEIIGWPLGTADEHEDRLADVIKTTIVAVDDAQRDAVVPAVESLGLTPGVATSPVTPGWSYVNITRGDVDKGTALSALSAETGVPLERIAVVGDGRNDISMASAAGTAIAMGDAPAELLAHAHHVVGTVEQDGAAAALRAIIAWNERV